MPVITPVVAGAALKLGTTADSFMQQRKIEKQLKDLQKRAFPRYTVTPQVQDIYSQAVGEASTPRGFGGAISNRFRQNLAQNLAARLRAGSTAAGGSGARGVNAVLAGQQADAMANFAAQDEGITRANRNAAISRMGAGANQIQSIQNMNTGQDINYRMMLERALGSGLMQQRDYTRSQLSGLGSDLITSGLGGGFNNLTPKQ